MKQINLFNPLIMLITSDPIIYESLKRKLDLNYVESKGWVDMNGLTPVDRQSIGDCIEIIQFKNKLTEINFRKKVIKKKIITLDQVSSVFESLNLLKFLTGFYEISKTLDFPYEDISELGHLDFELEQVGKIKNRIYNLFNGENFILLYPRLKPLEMFNPYNGAQDLNTEIYGLRLKELQDKILEIGPIVEKFNKNIIICPPTSYLDYLVELNEDKWEQEVKLGEQNMNNMIEESEDEIRRWDDEDPTWRIANDFD